MEEHPETIQNFVNALQKGMDYVQSHTPEEIAKAIEPQFPESDLETITTIVKIGRASCRERVWTWV